MLDGEENAVVQDAPAQPPASGEDQRRTEAEAAFKAQDSAQPEQPAIEEAAAGHTEDDTEEVEWEGKRYVIPKAVKPALMMNADYTRKTQEVAATRKELEARQAEITQQAEALKADTAERARLVLIEDTLAEFGNVDWDRWEREDFVAAQAGWRKYQQLKDQRETLSRTLREKDQQRSREAQQKSAKRLEEAERILSRDLKGWGPEMVAQLRPVALAMGYTADELEQLDDPRVVKGLHARWQLDQVLKAQSTNQPNPPAPAPAPLQQIQRGRAPAGKAPLAQIDDMDAYVKARKAGQTV